METKSSASLPLPTTTKTTGEPCQALLLLLLLLALRSTTNCSSGCFIHRHAALSPSCRMCVRRLPMRLPLLQPLFSACLSRACDAFFTLQFNHLFSPTHWAFTRITVWKAKAGEKLWWEKRDTSRRLRTACGQDREIIQRKIQRKTQASTVANARCMWSRGTHAN